MKFNRPQRSAVGSGTANKKYAGTVTIVRDQCPDYPTTTDGWNFIHSSHYNLRFTGDHSTLRSAEFRPIFARWHHRRSILLSWSRRSGAARNSTDCALQGHSTPKFEGIIKFLINPRPYKSHSIQSSRSCFQRLDGCYFHLNSQENYKNPPQMKNSKH